jgi:hypothetical protein
MIVVAQTLLYMLAVAGIVASSLGAINFVGGAMNSARPGGLRRKRWLYAALCVCGIVASATLGFLGIPALLYAVGR